MYSQLAWNKACGYFLPSALCPFPGGLNPSGVESCSGSRRKWPVGAGHGLDEITYYMSDTCMCSTFVSSWYRGSNKAQMRAYMHIQMWPILRPRGLSPTRLLCTWYSPGKEYWNGLPFPPSAGSSWPRNLTWVSCVSSIGRQILYHWATWEDPIKPNTAYIWLQRWQKTI